MSRRRNNRRVGPEHTNIIELSQALVLNGRAIDEGPRRKTWTSHDIRGIRPLTPAQHDMFHAFFSGANICAYGTTGTGKSFVGLYLALSEVLNKNTPTDHIVIVRSVVPTREVGHLPGTLDEKQSVYEEPYRDIFTELLGHPNSYNDMKTAGVVKFQTSSFVRGLTWDNAVIVIDEFQNMVMDEFDGVFTRAGENSRVIVCGDNVRQCDLKHYEVSAAERIIQVLDNIPSVESIKFGVHDVVRSGLAKSWIQSREDLKI